MSRTDPVAIVINTNGMPVLSWIGEALPIGTQVFARQAPAVQSEPAAWIFRELPEAPLQVTDRWDVAKHLPLEVTAVYTHADPGEVERLTEQLEVANQAIAYAAQQVEEKQKVADALMADAKQFRAERDTLRARVKAQALGPSITLPDAPS